MKVVSLDANKVAGNVLPGSVRRFEVRYGDKEAPAVSAPFFEHVSYQMDNFALGMYTASLSLTFGASGKALSSVTYFMFPWQLLTIVLVGLLIVVIVFIVLVKHYNRWIIRQARSHHSK